MSVCVCVCMFVTIFAIVTAIKTLNSVIIDTIVHIFKTLPPHLNTAL